MSVRDAIPLPVIGEVRRRIKVVATKRCDVGCPMCFWSPEVRATSPVIGPDDLRVIAEEAAGFDDVHIFDGEYEGCVDQIVMPLLRACGDEGILRCLVTTSGICFSESELHAMLSTYPGRFNFALSIDGDWGHSNWHPESKNGDVLERFVRLRDSSSDRVALDVHWTHQPSRVADAQLAEFRERCDSLEVFLNVANLVIESNGRHHFGPSVNPYRCGLKSPQLDNREFTACAFPCRKHDRDFVQVQVDYEGVYRICHLPIDEFSIGTIGTLGRGGLMGTLSQFFNTRPNLSRAISTNGILEAIDDLSQTDEAREEVKKHLDREYPVNCGLCGICERVSHLYSLLDG